MYTIPHLYVVKYFWSFEIQNFQMYVLWIFKVLKFHIFEIVNVFIVCLIGYYHLSFFYHQLFFIIWILWKSFEKMSFFNNNFFHFQKFLTKQKLKIGSNAFLIWVSSNSCVLKCVMITMVSNDKNNK